MERPGVARLDLPSRVVVRNRALEITPLAQDGGEVGTCPHRARSRAVVSRQPAAVTAAVFATRTANIKQLLARAA